MKIQKDNTIIECSKGTYESMYKRLGYEIVSEKKVEKKQEPKIEEKVEEVIEQKNVEANKKRKK